jgi:hypothetical protein
MIRFVDGVNFRTLTFEKRKRRESLGRPSTFCRQLAPPIPKAERLHAEAPKRHGEALAGVAIRFHRNPHQQRQKSRAFSSLFAQRERKICPAKDIPGQTSLSHEGRMTRQGPANFAGSSEIYASLPLE